MTSYELTHFKKMVRVWKTKSLLFCLRYDPLIVFRRQNHITFIFIKTMSHELLFPDLGNQKLTTWVWRLSFAVIEIQNLSQVVCGHFAGTNQNGQTNKCPQKPLVVVITFGLLYRIAICMQDEFLLSHAISQRLLDCRKIIACRCLNACQQTEKVIFLLLKKTKD